MTIPNDLKYTKDHEWVKMHDGSVTVGITDYAQKELGDIVFVEFPELNDHITKDEPFGTIEAVKTVADLFAPLSGEIININDEIEDAPDFVNSDPYGDGWLVKIKIPDESEWNLLMSASDYENYLKNDS
ncbi:MAG: glycine cleavage system protein GcvH [Candidatus Marinimicrobia bacterium]|jgi:glycine cleavage system H protein|nr:glycine cleavage system protein GcvH [Candidatus Neomarinimicrobiota bacterium]MBT3618454.1 glycine cleavage system protein GcvH [Candidatus Neomarinimicrobiota bacterium]MBT3828990.1 glycine cleavage system protein GcvH [Candidatus Neomarinimicrobiota bacterium]MBT3997967.1 glycine cleavage system protein GcvH [Candidatus Neomarinimicrobiota bacterium]MBT4280049.1 glycine cleavage system protein GcvH [Candidatus Neomarinimicrobiota bacterium]